MRFQSHFRVWKHFTAWYDLITFGFSCTHEVESGQLQILSTGSNIRVPGHDWVEGRPLLHLKYFLQFVTSGNSSPSWPHSRLDEATNSHWRKLYYGSPGASLDERRADLGRISCSNIFNQSLQNNAIYMHLIISLFICFRKSYNSGKWKQKPLKKEVLWALILKSWRMTPK